MLRHLREKVSHTVKDLVPEQVSNTVKGLVPEKVSNTVKDLVHRYKRDEDQIEQTGAQGWWDAMPVPDWTNSPDIQPTLLPVPDNLVQPGDMLCDVCKAIDLSLERFIVDPEHSGEVDQQKDATFFLGRVEGMRKKSHCPLCRLVLVAIGGTKVPSFEDGEPVHVSLDLGTEFFTNPPEFRVLRPSAQKQEDEFLGVDKTNLFPEITLLANDSPNPSAASLVRPINQEQINFGMVRDWIMLCRDSHGASCQKPKMLEHGMAHPAELLPSFRLIDTTNECLVRGVGNVEYVCLSYVWGRVDSLRTLVENFEALEKPGALGLPEYLEKLPWTIRDAMQVVRETGLRWLWIDCLCIVQDDTTGEKMAAIVKMDLIYGAAFMTIQAAGKDSNVGLPGVRPGTRGSRQPIEEIKPGLRLAYKQKTPDFASESVYYTRAWCYQERIFSRRKLLFVGGQVTFECEAGEWREDSVNTNSGGEGDGTGEGNGRNRLVDRPNDIGAYEGLIQSYTDLKMSYDSDIYNSFAGVATGIAMDLNTALCHGLPELYFDWFLLWVPLEVQSRRLIAPSWSWSGWYGGSWPRMWDWYTRNMEKVNKALPSRTWIVWYQRQANNSTECRRLKTHDSHPSGSSRARSLKSRFPFDCSQNVPTHRTLTQAPEYTSDIPNPQPGSGFLQFWTVSVTFRLDKPIREPKKSSGFKKHVPAAIFGSSERQLGICFVPEDWLKEHVPGEHEFIVLCEGRDERAERGQEDQEPGWKYQLMLVEPHEEWAERVSLGSINKHNLQEGLGQGPVWREIVLG